MVPEAEFLNTQCFQEAGSLRVMGLPLRVTVLESVEFDRQARLFAEKVQVVSFDGMLASKFVSGETSVPQPLPHQFLGPGGSLPEGTSTLSNGHRGERSDTVEKFNKDNGFNARPHPGPLPQERENRKSVFGGEHIVGGRGSSVNGARLVGAIGVLEESGSVDGYSLSLGERVRVRASVSLANMPGHGQRNGSASAPVRELHNGFEKHFPGTGEYLSRSGRGRVGVGAAGREDNGLDDRPHPGPLPQERENRESVFGGEQIVGGCGFSVNGERLAAETGMMEASGRTPYQYKRI
jgi:hypothetical protein